MIESAIITPLLLLLILGIFEFGLAFQNYLGVANTARDAARAASVGADNPNADWRMLLAAERGSAAIDADLERIIVYTVSSPSDPVPAACLTSSTGITGVCNVYDESDFGMLEEEFGCALSTLTPAPDEAWCPTDRNAIIDTAAGTRPDFIGVYVRMTHDYITGLFGDSVVLEDQIVLRIEPQGR